MKPNLVIVQPPHSGDSRLDSVVEKFCEDLSDNYYVYLIRPHAPPRDDSPGGVRFLNVSLDELPGFGSVELAIAISDLEIADRLKATYPESKLAVWQPRDKAARVAA